MKHDNVSSTLYPPLDVNKLGVPQPTLPTKDVVIIIFMFLLWGYSLYLTYRAWYKESSGTMNYLDKRFL